jgi:hypothetical protein
MSTSRTKTGFSKSDNEMLHRAYETYYADVSVGRAEAGRISKYIRSLEKVSAHQEIGHTSKQRVKTVRRWGDIKMGKNKSCVFCETPRDDYDTGPCCPEAREAELQREIEPLRKLRNAAIKWQKARMKDDGRSAKLMHSEHFAELKFWHALSKVDR